MTEKKFKFVGDRLNASFRSEIYLNDGKILDGYSKHINHDEPKDREKCLVGFVSRLITNGYIQKSQYIVFYTNLNIGKDRDSILVELTPKSVTLSNEAELMLDLSNFLNNVYLRILDGQSFDEVRPTNRKSFSPDLFKIAGQFSTKQDLIDYCKKLTIQGVPNGRRDGFYYAYLRAYPNLHQTAQTPIQTTPVDVGSLIQSSLGSMHVGGRK